MGVDWNSKRPKDQPGLSAEFWRGFAIGAIIVAALWLVIVMTLRMLWGA
jgi:hypothetical protein